ncbi:MAG: pantetheine-phosphate adenylyltransferase [Spirochaetes bacterium]|nr:pantetheine-phosphate adenylyltransferase [Spirochaetota bacterium]
MKTPHAVYAGSFDPFTLGHYDILIRALSLFDAVTVAIAVNPEKKSRYTFAAREEMIRASVTDDRLSVVSFDGLLTDFMKQKSITAAVRGIRNGNDLVYESQMAAANRTLYPAMETVFLVSDPRYAHISATLVRDVMNHGGDISAFVPEAAAAVIHREQQR